MKMNIPNTAKRKIFEEKCLRVKSMLLPATQARNEPLCQKAHLILRQCAFYLRPCMHKVCHGGSQAEKAAFENLF